MDIYLATLVEFKVSYLSVSPEGTSLNTSVEVEY